MRIIRLAVVTVLAVAAAQAKVKPRAFYTAGTLDVPPGASATLEQNDRELSVQWNGNSRVLQIPYANIIFIEKGTYSPKGALGFLSWNNDRVLAFLTLIYQDDWKGTAALQLQLEGSYRAIPEAIGSASKIVVHNAYSDVTALSRAYGSGLPSTRHKLRLWSATAASQKKGAAAWMKLTPTASEVVVGPERKLIPYSSITSLEYSQTVGINIKKLIALGVITEGYGALFLRKQVRHLLSVTYTENGTSQVMVLELPKYFARALIIELELRSGRRVEFDSGNAAANIYG